MDKITIKFKYNRVPLVINYPRNDLSQRDSLINSKYRQLKWELDELWKNTEGFRNGQNQLNNIFPKQLEQIYKEIHDLEVGIKTLKIFIDRSEENIPPAYCQAYSSQNIQPPPIPDLPSKFIYAPKSPPESPNNESTTEFPTTVDDSLIDSDPPKNSEAISIPNPPKRDNSICDIFETNYKESSLMDNYCKIFCNYN